MRASSASADAGVIDAIVTMIDAASIFGIIQRRALFGLQNVEGDQVIACAFLCVDGRANAWPPGSVCPPSGSESHRVCR